MGKPNETNADSRPDFQALYDLGLSICIVPRGEKHPAMQWTNFQTARAPESLVKDWHGANANVAIITGALSNLFVIDVDSDEAQALLDEIGMPKTPTVRTSRGRHYYFRNPPYEVRNKVHIRGIALDVRGEGGLVIGPGSMHASGAIYEWEVPPTECDFAELPTGFLKLLEEESRSSSLAKQTDCASYIEAEKFSFWFNRQVTEGVAALREAKEGKRNDTLFRVAVELANHTAALALDWEGVAAILSPEALAIGLSGSEIDSTLQSAWKRGQQSPTQWLTVANQWMYVATPDRFWSERTKQELKPRAFSRQFADVKPFEKGEFAEFLTNAGLIDKVLDFRFEPSQPRGPITYRGERFFNTYHEPGIKPDEGDWTPLTDFLEYLIPDKFERDHLVQMIAWTVANPGEKLSYALLLQSKAHGIGKSTLVEIWRSLLGFENTRMTNSEEMDSPYQSYLENTLLVALEELDLGSGIATYNRLKAMITSPTAVINVKYRPQREVPNYANFVFLSNLEAPIFIEQADRRFFVIDSPAQPKEDAEYWTNFYAWWKANMGVVKAYFESIYVGDFEPKAHPPMTPAKERLMKQSETPLVQNLRELLDEMNYPLREVCTIDDIRKALRTKGMKLDSPQRLSKALQSLGCQPLGQSRLSTGKASLWALQRADYWQTTSHKLRREAYEGAMGDQPQMEEVA
ncbi:bifunctional DNA primase/polymerase [Erythrobacter sp. G21629-S1]|nr:bifunctional DNA primase/polymerase [Erythrobacter sp. G21629-S1]